MQELNCTVLQSGSLIDILLCLLLYSTLLYFISLYPPYHHHSPCALDAAKRNLSALAHQFARNKAHSDSAERSKLINDEEAVSEHHSAVP